MECTFALSILEPVFQLPSNPHSTVFSPDPQRSLHTGPQQAGRASQEGYSQAWDLPAQTYTTQTRRAAQPLTSGFKKAHVVPMAVGQGKHACGGCTAQQMGLSVSSGGEDKDTFRLDMVPKHKDNRLGPRHMP